MIKDIKHIFHTKEVYEIYSLCMYMPTFKKFKAKAAAYANDINTNIYGFYDGNLLVGVIAVRNNADKKAELLGIAVKHTHQNMGIGRQLIMYSVEHNSISDLFAETDDDAVLFYQKCGFQTEGFYKTYGGNKCKRYKCSLYTSATRPIG